MTERSLYILNVKFGNQHIRLFFEGPNEETGGRDEFNATRRGINEIGDNISDFESFLGGVIAHFATAGFLRIAH